MRQACVIETHGLSYRQKFLQSYREAYRPMPAQFVLLGWHAPYGGARHDGLGVPPPRPGAISVR